MISGDRIVRAASALLGVAFALAALSDPSWIGGAPGFGWTQAVLLLVGAALAAGCLAPLRWSARLLALVVSSCLVVALAEIVLQALYSPRYRGSSQYDEQTLYRLSPGAVREYRRQQINGGDRIVYRVNSAGFRGEELEPDPELRVVVYGDSFIQAEYSHRENTFAERLEHHLARRIRGSVEVVNAGVAGYGPDQVLVKMEREIPSLDPDLIVVAVFAGNDFGDPIRNKLFQLDPSGKLAPNAFSLDPSFVREMSVRRNELISKQIVEEWVFAVADLLRLRSRSGDGVEAMTPRERMDFFVQQHLREYEQYVVEGDRVIRELAWDSYDADVSLLPGSDSARYKVALMDGIVGRMQAFAASHSIPLVLMPIPHPVDLGGHGIAEVDREKYPDYRPRGMVDSLEAIARRHGIPAVDLFTPFRDRGTEALYFRGLDDHWNDQGQDLAARVVSEFLVSGGHLESARGTRPVLRDSGD